MYYAMMRPYDIANGTGIRTTLFVSGCTHKCPGCFNEPYQDFSYGTKWDQEAEDTFMSYVTNANVYGVTVLGGEPLDQIQDDDLINLLRRIKKETNQTIWIYSGYTYEHILGDEKKREILELCDVLVDGRFVEALKDITLKFRGSSNQRLIDIQKSLQQNTVVLQAI